MKLSLGDKLAIWFIKRVNSNPERKDKVVKKMKFHYMLATRFLRHRVKKGYIKTIENADICPIEIYKQKNSTSKKVIYVVHGGGFIMGLINTYRNLVYPFSKATNDAIIALTDYRTAPKHQYPSAHDDVMSGYKYLLSIGYSPKDIIFFGDSSGGNLILSTLLKLKDEGAEMPKGAVVMSPWADLMASGKSYKDNYNKDAIFGRKHTKKSVSDEIKMERILASGLFSYANDADKSNKYLSPVYGEYDNMPPMLMIVGDSEMLLDDTLTIVKKIEDSGGEVELHIGQGMFHGYPLFYNVSKQAKIAFEKVLKFIKKHTE